MKSKKLWGGRFEEAPSSIMVRMGESISYDKTLFAQDVRGSIAHARMLQKIGILSKVELKKMELGLLQVLKEIKANQFEFKIENEDIHMSIESRLTEIIGDLGKKLHTGRSRNDQVSQDVRLYLKDEIILILESFLSLLAVWIRKAESSIDIIFPGYTHLQIAQPIRASHYFLSHFWANVRDFEEFLASFDRADELVLGSGALAGVNYPTDRVFLQKELRLSAINENSIDGVSQRDHILKFLFSVSQFSLHASRFAEEVILFSSLEFSYFRLPDSLTTGSSIMPQKKNPDIAELIRGKAGRVIGGLNHLMVMIKGTPFAYNRDFQEDKIPLFDAVNQVKLVLEGVREMVRELKILEKNTEKSLKQGFATATDLADWLVKRKGLPFRSSHEIVGELVKRCTEKHWTLDTIPKEERKKIHEALVDPEYEEAISLETSCEKKDVRGGTARRRQIEQISKAKQKLNDLTKQYIQRKGKLK
ncbi:argininosuccinate lyase [Leptospira ryugenii]|uniref:Argininosuccinate lyase n=1 Tax=Leptospira ryugenii TaxID=1917863 RepID=A0A2P2DWL0_9LEPT|nr:argininosuccinate lyase [Leptospira ryugenii]GBF49002.1 argininosuccinate lyase [Leptospira ryugenii]